MAKDPAFLFYYQDFLVGTSFMTLEEVGAYIKLLCFQADKGELTEKEILKKIPLVIWESICCKFEQGAKGYFNRRLQEEVLKRRLYTESRRKNLHMGKHMGTHMGGAMTPHMENENEDVNENKDVIEISSFFNYFCLKTQKNLKLTKERRHLIAKRLKDGYTIDQLKTAVDNFI